MLKQLNDKIALRTAIVLAMTAILTGVREGGKAITADQQTAWSAKRDEHNALDAEIKILEEQYRIDLQEAAKKPLEKQEEEAAKRWDLSRAITAVGNNRQLDGIELEMHQEAERELEKVSNVGGNIYIPSFIIKRAYMTDAQRANEETKTTGLASGNIPLAVNDVQFNVARPLYDELGTTVIPNLSVGKLDLPFSKGFTAAKVAELGSAVQSVPTATKDTLTAFRYQGWQNYTAGYLAESAVMPSLMSDMLMAIDRGVGKDLMEAAVAANVLTGYATTDIKAAVTWPIILSMISELETESFVSEGYVFSKAEFYKLATTQKGTNLGFIVDFLTGNNRGKVAGINAFGTGYLPVHDTDKYDLIYGDWRQAYVAFWSGAQILVDPFTASDTGLTKLTFFRLGDTAVNPYTFSSIRNADAA